MRVPLTLAVLASLAFCAVVGVDMFYFNPQQYHIAGTYYKARASIPRKFVVMNSPTKKAAQF